METDKELKETFSLSIDEDNSFIYLNYLKFEVENYIRRTELIAEGLKQILKNNPDKYYFMIIDLLNLEGKGGGDLASPQVKKIYSELAKEKQILKVAVLLANPVIEGLGKVIVGSVGLAKKINFFNNRTQALAWLRKKDD